jgi:hypothetical protein
VKRLAGEILGQRGDVEVFFLQVITISSNRSILMIIVPIYYFRLLMKCESAWLRSERNRGRVTTRSSHRQIRMGSRQVERAFIHIM